MDQRNEWRLRIAGDDLEDWGGEGGDGEEDVLGYVEGAGCEEEGEWEVDGGWVNRVAVLADLAEEEFLDCGHGDSCGEVMGPVCFALRFSCA